LASCITMYVTSNPTWKFASLSDANVDNLELVQQH
jgi:hypothetical protein